MTDTRQYPETPAGPFPVPPLSFIDKENRQISIRVYGEGPLETKQEERDALAEMYNEFDPADRAQGIPPTTPEKINSWLTLLFENQAIHVFAWHNQTVAGHAVLVPENSSSGPYELAIFVHQDYQLAGIGSTLLEGLLGEAATRGVTKIWLTVERWNDPAIHLYRKVGFEVTNSQSFELEMTILLDG